MHSSCLTTSLFWREFSTPVSTRGTSLWSTISARLRFSAISNNQSVAIRQAQPKDCSVRYSNSALTPWTASRSASCSSRLPWRSCSVPLRVNCRTSSKKSTCSAKAWSLSKCTQNRQPTNCRSRACKVSRSARIPSRCSIKSCTSWSSKKRWRLMPRLFRVAIRISTRLLTRSGQATSSQVSFLKQRSRK